MENPNTRSWGKNTPFLLTVQTCSEPLGHPLAAAQFCTTWENLRGYCYQGRKWHLEIRYLAYRCYRLARSMNLSPDEEIIGKNSMWNSPRNATTFCGLEGTEEAGYITRYLGWSAWNSLAYSVFLVVTSWVSVYVGTGLMHKMNFAHRRNRGAFEWGPQRPQNKNWPQTFLFDGGKLVTSSHARNEKIHMNPAISKGT